MKRYALFVFPDYYPGGGWSDFEGSFDTIEAAVAELNGPKVTKLANDAATGWSWQVIDLETGDRVAGEDRWFEENQG